MSSLHEMAEALEQRRNRWMIRLPGRLPFAMVGMKMSYEEALRCARLIWEDCEIE